MGPPHGIASGGGAGLGDNRPGGRRGDGTAGAAAGGGPRARPGIAVALAAVLTAALAACQTLSDVQPGQGHSFTISGRPYDEVWAASLKVAEQHLVVQEQSKTEGVILGERTGTGGGWFGVYLTGAGANAYRVEVVRKGKYVGQIAWANWEARMVRDIQTALGIAPAR